MRFHSEHLEDDQASNMTSGRVNFLWTLSQIAITMNLGPPGPRKTFLGPNSQSNILI